jgi:hypothetical protein
MRTKARSLALAAVAGCAAALAPGTGLAGRVELDARVFPAVNAIAGRAVTIRCTAVETGQFEALGHADFKRRRITLQPSLCRRINELVAAPAAGGTPAAGAQARALLVLAHEAVHLSSYAGRTNEALTECRAIQLVATTARALGVDAATASALGHEALRFDALLPGPGDWLVGLGEVPSYHSPDCYDGGPLDIHPDSSDWPN